MFILDSLLIDGLSFVFDKIARAADADLDDETHLRERLVEGQMQLDSGELSAAEYEVIERDVLQRLSVMRRQRTADDPSSGFKVTGADVRLTTDDDES